MISYPKKLTNVSELLAKKYRDDLIDLRDYVENDFNSELLSDDFFDAFKIFLASDALNTYSPLKHYFLKAVEDFFYIVELHYDEEDGGLTEDDDEEMSEEERLDEIHEAWLETPFATAFTNMIESEEMEIAEASMALIPLMESQIISFAYLHFDSEIACETAFLYNMTPEFGDFDHRLNLLEKRQYVFFENTLELYPSLPIGEVNDDEKLLGLEVNGEMEYIPLSENDTYITLQSGKRIEVIAGIEMTREELMTIKNDLKALFQDSHIRETIAEYNLKNIIISSFEDDEISDSLPETIHIGKNVKDDLDQELVKLVISNLKMATEFTTEDDFEEKFIDPMNGKKAILNQAIAGHLNKILMGESSVDELLKIVNANKLLITPSFLSVVPILSTIER